MTAIGKGLALRMNNQFIQRGVLMQIDYDLVDRMQGRAKPSLTYGQAVEYQILRNRDVAKAAYKAETQGSD